MYLLPLGYLLLVIAAVLGASSCAGVAFCLSKKCDAADSMAGYVVPTAAIAAVVHGAFAYSWMLYWPNERVAIVWLFSICAVAPPVLAVASCWCFRLVNFVLQRTSDR